MWFGSLYRIYVSYRTLADHATEDHVEGRDELMVVDALIHGDGQIIIGVQCHVKLCSQVYDLI
jgi:hypothetical protein